MMEWWDAREPREQLLIKVFGALLVVAVFVQFALFPLLQTNSDRQLRNQQAMQTLDVVTSSDAILSRTAGGSANSTQASISEVRTAALALAAQRGLAISRIQGGNGDEIIMILDKASPQILYAWLADIQLQYGARPSSISLSGDASGGVRASVAFGGGDS